ncbi:MAG: hypothetical protein IKA83_04975 [Paludibacteraceae bacterium]|nr:hypothetical protein [Paludibacteraceae bacterium]
MKRFLELINGEQKYLYDRKEDKMYLLEEEYVEELKSSIQQIAKFCPYIEEVGEYDDDRYNIDKLKDN